MSSLRDIEIDNLKKDVAECQNDIELIKRDIIELKQKQSDERLQLLTKEVQELKEMLKSVLK